MITSTVVKLVLMIVSLLVVVNVFTGMQTNVEVLKDGVGEFTGNEHMIADYDEELEDYLSADDRKVKYSLDALVCGIESVASNKLDPSKCKTGQFNTKTCKDGYLFGTTCLLPYSAMHKCCMTAFGTKWVRSPNCEDQFVVSDDNCEFKLMVKDFNLPQKINKKESLASDWIAGYGDPKYVLYYEQFPEGQEKYWTADITSFSPGMLVFSSLLSAALPVPDAVSDVAKYTKYAKGGAWDAVKKGVSKTSLFKMTKALSGTVDNIAGFLTKSAVKKSKKTKLAQKLIFATIPDNADFAEILELKEIREYVLDNLDDLSYDTFKASKVADEFNLDAGDFKGLFNTLDDDAKYLLGESLESLEDMAKRQNLFSAFASDVKNSIKNAKKLPKKFIEENTKDAKSITKMIGSGVINGAILASMLPEVEGFLNSKSQVDQQMMDSLEKDSRFDSARNGLFDALLLAGMFKKNKAGKVVTKKGTVLNKPVGRVGVAVFLSFMANKYEGLNNKYKPQGKDGFYVSTPTYIEDEDKVATPLQKLTKSSGYLVELGNDGTVGRRRLHFISPCETDLLIEKTPVKMKIPSNIYDYDLYFEDDVMIPVKKNTLTYERGNIIWTQEAFEADKRVIERFQKYEDRGFGLFSDYNEDHQSFKPRIDAEGQSTNMQHTTRGCRINVQKCDFYDYYKSILPRLEKNYKKLDYGFNNFDYLLFSKLSSQDCRQILPLTEAYTGYKEYYGEATIPSLVGYKTTSLYDACMLWSDGYDANSLWVGLFPTEFYWEDFMKNDYNLGIERPYLVTPLNYNYFIKPRVQQRLKLIRQISGVEEYSAIDLRNVIEDITGDVQIFRDYSNSVKTFGFVSYRDVHVILDNLMLNDLLSLKYIIETEVESMHKGFFVSGFKKDDQQKLIDLWVEIQVVLSKKTTYTDSSSIIKLSPESPILKSSNWNDIKGKGNVGNSIVSESVTVKSLRRPDEVNYNYCSRDSNQLLDNGEKALFVASLFLDEIVGAAAGGACGAISAGAAAVPCAKIAMFATNVAIGFGEKAINDEKKWPKSTAKCSNYNNEQCNIVDGCYIKYSQCRTCPFYSTGYTMNSYFDDLRLRGDDLDVAKSLDPCSFSENKKTLHDIKENGYSCNSGSLKGDMKRCLSKDLCYWDYKGSNSCKACPLDGNFNEKDDERLSLYKQECGLTPVVCSSIKKKDVCSALTECDWQNGCKDAFASN